MLRVHVRFPLGVYHAQALSSFSEAEWPPHPVRLIGALIAAAHATDSDAERARRVVQQLCESAPPRIVAPRGETIAGADGVTSVARLRGASRWAPRNHELTELAKGVSPRDPGRGRAEVHKVGVAIGDAAVTFEWPDLVLDNGGLAALSRLAEDMTVLGTSRSPVLVSVDDEEADDRPAWTPAERATDGRPATEVRTPTPDTIASFDRWHARRGVVTKDGGPARAPYVPPASIGRRTGYVHSSDDAAPGPVDPRHWGDMLVLAIDREATDVLPKAPTTFALARATRKALLSTYGQAGRTDEAPPILRGRASEPHAALVPLNFVAPFVGGGPGATHADGRTIGIAVLLPHVHRAPDVVRQRLAVERGLVALALGGGRPRVAVLVPGVGDVWLKPVPQARVPWTLTEDVYRAASRAWTSVTPIVHSRYLPRRTREALFEQVAADCVDVGLPLPRRVVVRPTSRYRGAPERISSRPLPVGWDGPLQGPQHHVDLHFDQPVVGPILLGRARHFGLGLCLPFTPGDRD